ncbi:MAG: hypothetical protein Sapg2KO_06190 [Saprospiraceae bacterium]
MKILVSPPKNKNLFYHEAQTARKARYIISGLQLLSGTTALIGIRLYFSDWLDDMTVVMQYVVMAVIAFVLVAPGEMGIRETWAYLFRAVLNRYNKGLNLFSLVLMGIVALFLTSYSFYLSQHATKSSMQRAAPKVELTDTKGISQSYNQEVKRISQDYSTQRNDINKRYQGLIAAENTYYDNKIQANEAEIDQLRRKGWATGQRYTSKINALEKKNRGLDTERAEKIRELKGKENGELEAITTWKRSAETEAKEEKQTTKADIQGRNQEIVDENKAFAQMFSTLIARFAAWSVILVILFTGYLEIFYYKTGIKRVVQFRSTDFQAPAFLELLKFPYVYLSRYMTNYVRARYDKLPNIVPAPGTEDLVDHLREDDAGEEAQFRPFNYEERASRAQAKQAEKAQRKEEKQAEKQANKQRKAQNSQSSSKTKEYTSNTPPKTNNRPQGDAGQNQKKESKESFFQRSQRYEQEAFKAQHRQKDREPKSSDASSLSDSLAEIFKKTNESFKESEERTSLDDLAFEQEIDYGATIKHVDRRTGNVQYFSMDDLDEKLADISSKMDDASEMYEDTGDPIYLASIEEGKNAVSYWQTRRMELHQKMHSTASF